MFVLKFFVPVIKESDLNKRTTNECTIFCLTYFMYNNKGL